MPICLASGIPDISGRQLTNNKSSGCGLRFKSIHRNRLPRPWYAASQRSRALRGQIFTMLRVKAHLALCYAEQSRKDSRLALARQCCDRNMNLCDYACSNECKKRAAAIWEVADNVVLACSCKVSWLPVRFGSRTTASHDDVSLAASNRLLR